MRVVPPLISSTSTGPLGICHLPRLWLKILLYSVGKLPDGYRHGEGGFDELTCTNLGIDREAFVHYIETERPDYFQLEEWVRNNASKLDADSVAKHNLRIRTGVMREELAVPRRAQLGISEEWFANADLLNAYDDWQLFHESLLEDEPHPTV